MPCGGQPWPAVGMDRGAPWGAVALLVFSACGDGGAAGPVMMPGPEDAAPTMVGVDAGGGDTGAGGFVFGMFFGDALPDRQCAVWVTLREALLAAIQGCRAAAEAEQYQRAAELLHLARTNRLGVAACASRSTV